METKLEKFLNPWTLLALNSFIIVLTELSGSGFERNGVIHLIAILFVLLAISRIFSYYDVYDKYLRLLIKGSVLALIIFSISHLVEFLAITFLKGHVQASLINVVNFYIMSMLMVAVGAEYFLRAAYRKSSVMTNCLISGIAVFFALTILTFFNKNWLSLESGGWAIYAYSAAVLVAFYLSASRLYTINKNVKIMRGFTSYYIAAFTLVAIAAMLNVFYLVLVDMGISNLQIIYTSHFLFYGALSLMFLAFNLLSNLGGVYSEIR